MEGVGDEYPCSLPFLPEDIIAEILSWLPLRPLIQLKGVCKSWRLLASDPRFAQKHAERSAAIAKDMVWRRHCRSSGGLGQYGVITTSQYHLKSCCIGSLYNEAFAKASELDHKLSGREYYHIVGSCHGLVCVYTDINSLFLWNPMTGSHSKLPDLDIETELLSSLRSVSVTYGFGYDQFSNDYKILALFRGNAGTAAHAELYSTTESLWRRVSGLPSGIILEKSKPGISVDQFLVWAGTCDTANRRRSIIISFDLCSGTFQELPQQVCEKGCFLLTLGELGGCLSMVCYCRRSYAEVWVMKEFGDGESWTTLVGVPGLVEFCRPLWVSNGTDILMELRSGLSVYDSEEGRFRNLMVGGLRSSLNAHVYLKTLVSPTASATHTSKSLN